MIMYALIIGIIGNAKSFSVSFGSCTCGKLILLQYVRLAYITIQLLKSSTRLDHMNKTNMYIVRMKNHEYIWWQWGWESSLIEVLSKIVYHRNSLHCKTTICTILSIQP